MEIPSATLIEITKMEGAVFARGDFDGIVGLSFPDVNDGIPTLFDDMIEAKVIKEELFSFYLNRQVNFFYYLKISK